MVWATSGLSFGLGRRLGDLTDVSSEKGLFMRGTDGTEELQFACTEYRAKVRSSQLVLFCVSIFSHSFVPPSKSIKIIFPQCL